MFKNSIQKKLRSRFFVTPKSGIVFDGVLISSDRGEHGYSVFVDVVAYPDQANPERIKGELYILNANIAYSQLVSHADD
jgi:hypothetical protein